MNQALILQLKERLDNIREKLKSKNPYTKTMFRELDLCDAYVEMLLEEKAGDQ